MLHFYRPTRLSLLVSLFLKLLGFGKHLVQALPSVYALQCLTGKVDKYVIKNLKNYLLLSYLLTK